MKRLIYLAVAFFIAIILLPICSVFAQTASKASLPQVSITYAGDTDKTILRRAQWIEGARKEGTMAWWSSIKPDQLQVIAAEFNKIYPFIKITYWRGQDNERDARLEAEHSIGRVTVDFCDAGEITSYPRWRGIGLVEKYTDIIPGIEKRDKRMYSKYGDWAQLGNNAIVPMYNTKLVSAAEAPRSWEDLLNPKWKGKIGLTADTKVWYTLALGEGAWGIEKTEDFLKKLKQQEPVWAAGHSAGYNLLIAGEYKIMAECYLRYVFDSQKKGAPVDWVKVRPVLLTGQTFTFPKKAPHPNAARLFIEWIFSPQGLATFEKVTGYGTAFPGSGTKLAKVLEGLPVVYRTEEVLLKATEAYLPERFSKILGVTPE